MTTPPFDEIETVFLDAGNTLVSIDFERVARVCEGHGLSVSPAALRRAEARARPAISARVHARGRTEGEDAFLLYVQDVLRQLPEALMPMRKDPGLASRVAAELREPGASDRLWCSVLPGTAEALERLLARSLRLVVVSNSDGTVERGLIRSGLRPFFDHVIDSHHVGAEKPAPEIFEAALARSGSPPARTLHVGDLYHADVLGARSCGIHAVLLDPWDDWEGVDCPRLGHLLALADAFETAGR